MDDLLKLENQLCFTLYALSREIIKAYKPILDRYGLTYTQYVTLLALWEQPSLPFKDLGKRLHLDSGTLTPLVKKLQAMGLVNKYRSPEDDRQVIVELTEKGLALKEAARCVPLEMVGLYEGQNPPMDILALKEEADALLKTLTKKDVLS